MKGTPSERFWAKVEGGDVDSCWLWTGATAGGGYGYFSVGVNATPRRQPAHRWAYESLRSAIPAGLYLDHLCRNRACVNPWHLEPVTHLVNVRRGAGHGSETHCPHGHEYSPANTYRAPRGDRQCRTCLYARSAAARIRRRSQTPAPTGSVGTATTQPSPERSSHVSVG